MSRRKLPQIRRLEGNPGHRAIIDSGIEAKGEPFVPDHLSDDAKAMVEMIRTSMPPGVYSRLDTFALAIFATAWSIHKRAVQEAQRRPLDPVWARIMRQQARIMNTYSAKLGLDPISRSTLHVPRPPSKFDRFLKQ
jgi:phage terminase small subunit